ncbi:hypothetical protein DICVIV_09516 [Dictyocaulus viviparus]|uniref:Uncharacterized protein n=1 Tax=Dictyocaulus viviparus TaxID=29172 RepID=A0A0D8XKZ7_DICVI|nr:hypothetical protein DICVIV_09516 [Dictyocaulus viviparus]
MNISDRRGTIMTLCEYINLADFVNAGQTANPPPFEFSNDYEPPDVIIVLKEVLKNSQNAPTNSQIRNNFYHSHLTSSKQICHDLSVSSINKNLQHKSAVHVLEVAQPIGWLVMNSVSISSSPVN